MNKKGIIVLLLLSFMSNGMLGTHNDRCFVSLDSIVHDSWFKKTFDSCMMMWGALRFVITPHNHQRALTSAELSVALDTMMGNLAYAVFCITQLHTDHNIRGDADIPHLCRVIDKIEKEIDELPHLYAMVDLQRIACVHHLLNTLKNGLCDEQCIDARLVAV